MTVSVTMFGRADLEAAMNEVLLGMVFDYNGDGQRRGPMSRPKTNEGGRTVIAIQRHTIQVPGRVGSSRSETKRTD